MVKTATLEPSQIELGVESPTRDTNIRRFTIAMIVGAAVVAPFYLWILTDLWNPSPSLYRTAALNLSDFYDLQARAIIHGHLYVPNGSLAAEAFVHNGHQYTYFGLFPSFLRMPILIFTHSLDGRLTALSILSAWLITGVLSSLLLWRVRLIARGTAALGRLEATSYGALIATIMGGSILVNLAANPWVYSEDIAWSLALTIASLFALIGILEAPSWGRVLATGTFILADGLNRITTGSACAIGAVVAAAWFASGSAGKDNRKWWLPVLLTGVIPLAIGSAVTWAKFGIFFGVPLRDWLAFKAHGLDTIKGSYLGVRYLPTTATTYLGFGGLHFSAVFPFITLPLQPVRAVGNVPLFGTDSMTSVPCSTPLLLLLTFWGLITVFRRQSPAGLKVLKIPLIAAAIPGGFLLIFGFLQNRYLGDILPFLVLGSMVGIVDLWRILESRRHRLRRVALVVVAVLGLFGIVANMAMAMTPTGWWSGNQAFRFVQVQKSISDITGHPLAANVVRGNKLPVSGPLDQLFVVGKCTGFYIAPSMGYQRWLNIGEKPSERSLCRTIVPRF